MTMSEEFEINVGDGHTIRGEIHGDGPPLVFSNSLGVTRAMWRDQVEDFSQDYKVILYDTRGHGASDTSAGSYSIDRLVRDVLDILDALNINRTHFCGLSLGGMTGQALALRAPERLLSLTLAATSSYMGPPEGWQKRIETVLAKGMNSISDAVLAKWFVDEGSAKENIVNAARDWLTNTNPVGYTGCCAAIRDMDMRAIVGGITPPALILAGNHDSATPIEHASFLHEEISGSILNKMAGGHLLNLEQPSLFTQSLRQFLHERRD